MTSKDYRTLDTGKRVLADDPSRGIWYAAGCTYWTDDWSALARTGPGIPCCPHCGAVGMQVTAGEWFGGAERHQSQGNPGYVNFLAQSKEQCKRPLKFMEWFQQWLQEHPNGRETNPRSNGD